MLKRQNDEGDHDNSAAKKICMDKVSKVLHVRNVSSELTEKDIANLAVPFGLIKYMVLTRKVGQSLLEMAHENAAKSMVEYYAKHPAQFFGKNIIIQYSRYENLSGKGMHPDAEAAVKSANEECRKLVETEPRFVLHVFVENWEGARVGHLHFYKMFHRFGKVARIIVFVQNPNPQALIELEDETAANVAKLQLSNAPCFYGHHIRVDFSNRKSLDVKHESDTGRDYTISPVSKEELNSIPNVNMFNNSMNNMGSPSQQQSQSMSNSSNMSGMNNSGNGSAYMNDYMMRSNNQMNSFNQLSATDALSMLQPLLQQAAANPAETLPMLQSLAPTISSLLSQTNLSNSMMIQSNCSNGNMMNNQSMGYEKSGRPGRNSMPQNCSPVLIVDNLNEDKIIPDALFILFGCYGDVLRVKILFNKKSTALVQFVDMEQSNRALVNLNNVILHDKPLKINFSKHQNISMPKPDEQNSVHLNKEYSNSKLHRFKRVTPRTLSNIYPPGPVLHVAGLPEKFRESDVSQLFELENFNVNKIKMINPNDKKMALVQLDSTDMAVEALVKMHDYNTGNSHLRVSFSKGVINN